MHERHIPIFDVEPAYSSKALAGIGCLGTSPFWETTLGRVPFYPLDMNGVRALDAEIGPRGDVALALRNAEMIRDFAWIEDAREALKVLQEFPVLADLPWHESMMRPTVAGALDVTGEVIDVDCVVIGGYDPVFGRLRIDHSWGEGWGEKGSAWLRFTDFCELMDEGGMVTALIPN